MINTNIEGLNFSITLFEDDFLFEEVKNEFIGFAKYIISIEINSKYNLSEKKKKELMKDVLNHFTIALCCNEKEVEKHYKNYFNIAREGTYNKSTNYENVIYNKSTIYENVIYNKFKRFSYEDLYSYMRDYLNDDLSILARYY